MGLNHDKRVAREIRENRGGARKGAGRPRTFDGAATSKHVILSAIDMGRLIEIRAYAGKTLKGDSATIRWAIKYTRDQLVKAFQAQVKEQT